MRDQIEQTRQEVHQFTITSKADLETFKSKFTGKKGIIPHLFTQIKHVDATERKQIGQELNALKNEAEQIFEQEKAKLDSREEQAKNLVNDVTLPGMPGSLGSRHPVSIVRNRIIEIFERIGFNLSEGPEIEDDWHNFTALNFPPNHPAREMQDTFFIHKNPDIALRTHTSSVQVRVMENEEPPIRTLSPGRVYRNEAITARAHCFFHQVEGLYVNEHVSFVDLKQTMLHFAKEMFGPGTRIRLRPSFFPFTEPSAELDIYWGGNTERDNRITKGTGWLEIGGCGMVDPNVLQNCNIDPEKYTGFAFGIGIERIAMLKYQIKDLRLFSENDVRFLSQFKGQ